MSEVFKMPPKAVCVHDLAGYGRCSFSVILPTLAAMGVQPCAVPTAILSTHTGGFTDFTFLDFTPHMREYYKHWTKMGLGFDAFYSGFLGSFEQIEIVGEMIGDFSDVPLVMVDPVMGDDGELYSTYTPEMMRGMTGLVKKADIITPNITEASFILYGEYREDVFSDRSSLRDAAKRLSELGPAMVAITGVNREHSVGTVCYDREKDEFVLTENERVPKSYPGTGDIFASIVLGELLGGSDLAFSCAKAGGFIRDVIEYSSRFDYPVREGVLLEAMLYKLVGDRGI